MTAVWPTKNFETFNSSPSLLNHFIKRHQGFSSFFVLCWSNNQPMPRFFNRIRKQLAKENRFFQYSRYAIGEILLVVVGILIALQVEIGILKKSL
jgi:hypothetical protein